MPLLDQDVHGRKRKRPGDKEPKGDKEATLRRKLHHALRDLRKVVKKARTFEVQKTLRKLKDARCKDPESDETKGLEAQMEMLKHLDHDQVAQLALMTKLRKDRILSADPTVQAVSVELTSNLVSPREPGTPSAKVQSRILSSKVLASEVMLVLEALETVLHPCARSEVTDNPRASPNIPKKRKLGSSREKAVFFSKKNAVDTPGEGGDEGYEDASGDEAVAEVEHGWESGTVGMLSGSGESVVGEEDDHDCGSADNIVSEDPGRNKPQRRGSEGQSEFLPSLLVGFTRGDSGSEFSDGEVGLVDGTKKNRRGQRARRAIWEKKFGKNANHIKKRDTEHRKPGIVPVDRRSAMGSSSRPGHTPILSRIRTYGREQVSRPTLEEPRGRQSLPSTRGQPGHVWAKQDERPLHPSWEAKRKQKSASIIPSLGTKIVFSES